LEVSVAVWFGDVPLIRYELARLVVLCEGLSQCTVNAGCRGDDEVE
jgi:hypothetical protein